MKNLSPIAKFTAVNAEATTELQAYVTELESRLGEGSSVWKSTPNLSQLLETDGQGNFRRAGSNRPIVLKSTMMFNKKKSATGKSSLVLTLHSGKEKFKISLQKFVASIYHPNLTNAISTEVKDGNHFNLKASNIKWATSRRLY